RDRAFVAVAGAAGSDGVLALAEDGDGVVWVGTEGGGVTRLSGDRLVATPALASPFVLALARSADGALWAGTARGLARVAGGRVATPEVTAALAREVIVAVHPDPQGRRFVGTYGGGLVHGGTRAIERCTVADGLPSNRVMALALDRHGS